MYDGNIELPFRKDRPSEWTTMNKCQKKGPPLFVYIYLLRMYVYANLLGIYISMYVCMYVCTYSMYLRICVSLGECMYVCMFVNICVMDNWIQFITQKCFSCAPQQEMVSLALYYPAYPAVLSRERSGACEYDSMHVRMNGGI